MPTSRLFSPRVSLFGLSVVSVAWGCSSSEAAAPASPFIGGGGAFSGATNSSGAAGAGGSQSGAKALAGGADGSGGQPTGSEGTPLSGTGGTLPSGSAGSPSRAGSSGIAGSGDAGAGGKSGGKVLMIAGAMPLLGVDLQIHDVLAARNLDVQDIRETAVTPADAQGKQLIIVSYSVLSTDFKAADFADVPVPLIVLDHNLLPPLGMTTAEGHGYQDNVTQITLTANNSPLNAGLPAGDVTIYSRIGEVFWGTPSANALIAATVKGDPSRPVTFGYPTGAMMAGRAAPAKRLQLFVAVHAPPPNPDAFLSADGLALVDAGIAWSLQN